VIEINSQSKELETAHVPEEVRHGLLRLHRIFYPPFKKRLVQEDFVMCVFITLKPPHNLLQCNSSKSKLFEQSVMMSDGLS
jgi:hypothetical protein